MWSRWANLGLAGALVVCAGACAQPDPDGTITKRDFSRTDPTDAGDEDLTGADLTGTSPFDMAGDMVRTTWTDHSINTSGNWLWGIWSNNAGLVYIVGDQSTLVKSTNGNTFALDTSAKPATVSDLIGLTTFGAGPTAAPMYTCGTGGKIWSYGGGSLAAGAGTWTEENLNGNTNPINGVWVAPNGDVYAIGGGNTALKKPASGAGAGTWTPLTGIDASAYNLWGYKTATGVVLYAVGYQKDFGPGKIWKSTGGNFVAETAPTNNALYGVWGSSDSDIYAVGDKGTILHSNGGGVWSMQASPTNVALETVTGASATEVYIGGDNGTILHKYGIGSTTWEKEVLPNPLENRNILGMWASPTEVWAVGRPVTVGDMNGLILKK